MEWSNSYIASQVITIITYLFLALTYYAKDRKKILILNFLSLIANGIAYILLNAWTGLAMCIVAIIRNIIFIIDKKVNEKNNNISTKDIIILLILFVISILFAIFTFDGIFSLLSVIATMLYTYSVWQKNTKVYKFLGIPIGILWVAYNIYVKSLFGIILETILLICSTVGYLLEKKKKSKEM